MIQYISITIVSLGLSYLLFMWLLKKQKTFQFNRFYLLTTLTLCLVAPILDIEVFDSKPAFLNLVPVSHSNLNNSLESVTISETQLSANRSENFHYVIWYAYLFVTAVFCSRFVINLISILRLIGKAHKQIGDLLQIDTPDNKQASSFFRYLFANPAALKNADYCKALLAHEEVHFRQLHTLDVICIQLLACFFWFNPFVWLYKRAISENHEFIADSLAIDSGLDSVSYSNIIIQSTQSKHRNYLTSGFNFIHIKKRILMLHQTKSSIRNRAIRISTAILLFTGLFMFSAFNEIKKPLLVVVDAGHGGHDTGNSNEKEIVLKISNALATYSNDKIKIIQTRSDDKFLTLSERAKIINNLKPDLFLSLHCNTSKNSLKSGVEVYYSSKQNNYKESFGYGWLLMNQQLENKVFTNGDMKEANFFLLKNVTVPGIFMELGFLSNEKDRQKLSSSKGQEDMVKAIYEGLLEIREKKELIELLDKS